MAIRSGANGANDRSATRRCATATASSNASTASTASNASTAAATVRRRAPGGHAHQQGVATLEAARPPAPAAPPAQQAEAHAQPQMAEAAAEARVHVAVDERIVAAVRHRQPVAGEPHVRQQPPLGHRIVVQFELRSINGEKGKSLSVLCRLQAMQSFSDRCLQQNV